MLTHHRLNTSPAKVRAMKRATSKSAARGAGRKSREQPVRQRAKRLPAHERRGLILKEAAVFFAENGFAASTRDLADRLGVRQALLYKYFESKEALIETVFQQAFSDQWTATWASALADESKPLAGRLAAFYEAYTSDPENLRLRLFMRGSLDGWPLPARISPIVAKSLIIPVVADLRKQEGLPDLSERPMMAGERELVFMLHGAIVQHQVRLRVHKSNVPDTAATTAFFVDTFLRSARASLKSLHEGKGDEALRQGAA